MGGYGWKPYVSVAERRAKALRKMEKLKKKGLDVKPVCLEGKKIVRTFWGEAWCNHLESFSDYENRLPRGRTYVRNGSVCHLDIGPGKISAMVSGSDIYQVEITVKPLAKSRWEKVKNSCAGQIGSILELLQGRLSKNVMTVVTNRDKGLFPMPGEMGLECSCPDWAVMCKHVAAVLYGVGARLDESPELLFHLRGVDHEELISADVDLTVSGTKTRGRRIAEDAIADVFGIEMTKEESEATPEPVKGRKKAVNMASPKTRVGGKENPGAGSKRETAVIRETKTNTPTREKSPVSLETVPVTGRVVAALRAKFGISQSEFASLLGVSAPTVAKWEGTSGPLNFQARSLAAWNAVKKLTKPKARKKLDDL